MARTASRADGRLVALGRVGLAGWRGKIARTVSRPVASRTSLAPAEVEALIGGVFLLITAIQIVALARRVLRAASAA